ncbi:hypothetical protein Tco_0703821 [Tanacetum coccineum]|uniref:Uncharacterized protein n=1 Tax=Tanacetum coccineum TaxID=301880 RepID=A0ABQ4XZX0_9ASTR
MKRLVRILFQNARFLKFKARRRKMDLSFIACIKADEKKLVIPLLSEDFPEGYMPVVRSLIGACMFLEDRSSSGFHQLESREIYEDRSEEEHEVHLKTILDLLKKEKLYAKFSKCFESCRRDWNDLSHNRNPFISRIGRILRRFIENYLSRLAKPSPLFDSKRIGLYVWVRLSKMKLVLKSEGGNIAMLCVSSSDGLNDLWVSCDASKKVLGACEDLKLRKGMDQAISDYECEINYTRQETVADALSSKKQTQKPRRVVAMVVTNYFRLKTKILEATKRSFGISQCPNRMLILLDMQLTSGWDKSTLILETCMVARIRLETARSSPEKLCDKRPKTFDSKVQNRVLLKPDVQVPLDEIEIDENLRFVEEPIEIVGKRRAEVEEDDRSRPRFLCGNNSSGRKNS